MHKKNKISLFAAPAKRPIPDYYNMHHFDTASI